MAGNADTWAAVAMAAVSNAAVWLKILADRRRSNGSSRTLKEIKEDVSKVEGKIDKVTTDVGSLHTCVKTYEARLDGVVATCADTRGAFNGRIQKQEERLFEHVTEGHKIP